MSMKLILAIVSLVLSCISVGISIGLYIEDRRKWK